MDFLDELKFLKEELKFKGRIKSTNYEKIVLAGMGGSGIAGKIFQDIYTKRPFCVVDDYRIPDFVDRNTLFISMSYSGNTAETMAATAAAMKRGAHVVTVSSGGKLSSYGDERIHIPRRDLQPRSAIGYMLIILMRSFGITADRDLKDAYSVLAKLDENNRECQKLAHDILSKKKIPVIYGGAPYKSVAYRWKTQFNENAKIIAYSSSFPELNHNDTMAIALTYGKKNFGFFVLDSEFDYIRKRARLTAKVAKAEFNFIKPQGKNLTSRLFYLIHYVDYITYYMAKERGINPADVHLVEEIKKGLKDVVV